MQLWGSCGPVVTVANTAALLHVEHALVALLLILSCHLQQWRRKRVQLLLLLLLLLLWRRRLLLLVLPLLLLLLLLLLVLLVLGLLCSMLLEVCNGLATAAAATHAAATAATAAEDCLQPPPSPDMCLGPGDPVCSALPAPSRHKQRVPVLATLPMMPSTTAAAADYAIFASSDVLAVVLAASLAHSAVHAPLAALKLQVIQPSRLQEPPEELQR